MSRTYYDLKIAFIKRIQPIIYKYTFRKFGKKSAIDKPLLIRNKKYISIGNDVIIKGFSRIEVVDKYGKFKYSPSLEIGNNTCIEFNLHISCINKIIIKENVMIAGNVTIVDNNHGYEDITTPVSKQELKSNGEVIIDEGSFIGMGSRIMPGVKIGKNCVIGANSVITKNIPDYSVVVGIPGKIIKRFDMEKSEWIKIQ